MLQTQSNQEASEGKGDGEGDFATSKTIKLNNIMNTRYFESALQLKTLPCAQSHCVLIVIQSELRMN